MVKKVSYLAALLIEVGGAHLKRRAIQYRMGTESINCDLGLPPTHPLVQVHYIFCFLGLPLAKFSIHC